MQAGLTMGAVESGYLDVGRRFHHRTETIGPGRRWLPPLLVWTSGRSRRDPAACPISRPGRRFYAEKVGLEPVEERPGGFRYECGAGWFALFESAGRPSGEHTQIAFEVDDLEHMVRELRTRGVVFEDYDSPGLRTLGGIASVEGNYPSTRTTGERAAWFHDSEGNLLAIGQPLR
jgi:catechol 2,3-dioxygenase-like lactoylglutathione lyase family enzyme